MGIGSCYMFVLMKKKKTKRKSCEREREKRGEREREEGRVFFDVSSSVSLAIGAHFLSSGVLLQLRWLYGEATNLFRERTFQKNCSNDS